MSNKSLFIQVSTYNPTQLAADLEHVYQEHRNSGEDDYIYNVVLTEVAQSGVLQSSKLAIIRPYLPGGSKQAFDNVFVGTGNFEYTGSNWNLPPWQAQSPYAAGILDEDFRWRNLIEQRRNWLAFDAWYGQPWHFYIGYEAVVTWFTNPDIVNAYSAYFIQSVWDAEAIANGRAILWSPSFWDRWTQLSTQVRTTIMNEVGRLFDSVPTWTGRRINWFHPQDARGTTYSWGAGAVQANDVLGWFQDLTNINWGRWDSLRLNMEHFKQDANGSIWPLSLAEFDQREQEYANVPLGACWSLRWWRGGHTEDVGGPETLFYGSTTYERADNIRWAHRQQVRTWLDTGDLPGRYADRALVADEAAEFLRETFGVEVQGDRYMRPYDPNPPAGRATNSDHLTAGAIDIFFRDGVKDEQYQAIKALIEAWEDANIVRYYIDLGANWAHRDHIHVSFQLGVTT